MNSSKMKIMFYVDVLKNWILGKLHFNISLCLRMNTGLISLLLLHLINIAAADMMEFNNHQIETIVTNGEDTVHSESKNVEKRFKVATMEFERVETPILIAMWIFCASIAKMCFHMASELNQKVPESCLLIVVGVAIGLALIFMKNIHITALTPDTFFLYMLPPIILDAGYFMPNRLFFDNLGTILMFAVVGTIFNTFAIGGSLWLVNKMGIFGFDSSVLELFLFAALISAVDPVAVLAVFEEIHVNEILYIVVFGESLLNDGVTVVLYHMFEAYNEMGVSNIIYTDLLASLASFVVVAVGGTVIGVVWGFLTGFVTRFTYQARVIEPVIILVMAYISYLNAELFHMSGILAITFCGITMKNYVEANISHKSHTTVKYTMKMLSSSSETIIFMFLGVSTVSEDHQWNTTFIVITIVFCTFYRFIGVMILTAVVNNFRLYKLNTVDKFVMAYGGLRGAVAFALALLINPHHVKHKELFITTTIAVVYFTVFIQGITIRPLVNVLNVKKAEKRKPTMNERIHERFMDHVMAGIEDILGHHGNHHLRDKFKRFDNQFIRPYLLRNHQGAEPKILETYSKLAMKDALDFMRRNASTLGNISHVESAIAIFQNDTASNLQSSSSCSHLETAQTKIDLEEVQYNTSVKDENSVRIHHILTTELTPTSPTTSNNLNTNVLHLDTEHPKPQQRRLSYSRHTVDEKDLLCSPNVHKYNTKGKKLVTSDLRKIRRRRKSKKVTKASDSKLSDSIMASIEDNLNYSDVSIPVPTLNETAVAENRKKEHDEYEAIEEKTEDEEDTGITFTVDPTNGIRSQIQYKILDHRPPFDMIIRKNPYQSEYFTPDELNLPWHRLESEEELCATEKNLQTSITCSVSCESLPETSVLWNNETKKSTTFVPEIAVQQRNFHKQCFSDEATVTSTSPKDDTNSFFSDERSKTTSEKKLFVSSEDGDRTISETLRVKKHSTQEEKQAPPKRGRSLLDFFRKDKTRCETLRLESLDSRRRSTSSIAVPEECYYSPVTSIAYLSPFSNTNIRRGSMLELNSSSNSVKEEDIFEASISNLDRNRRFRSESVSLPYRKDSMICTSKNSSSSSSTSSSSSSDNDQYSVG